MTNEQGPDPVYGENVEAFMRFIMANPSRSLTFEVIDQWDYPDKVIVSDGATKLLETTTDDFADEVLTMFGAKRVDD